MKKVVRRLRFSKYKRFTEGLLFAIISGIALILCLSIMTSRVVSSVDILLPFSIAIISMLLGFVVMFRQDVSSKGRYKA